MTSDDIKIIIDEINKVPPDQAGTYKILLVTRMIRDIAYYAILAAVVWALGRRIIMAIVASWRESRRVRP